MNQKTLYHCMGSCAGVAKAPQNCEAESCDRFGEPLTGVVQCESCATDVAPPAIREGNGGAEV